MKNKKQIKEKLKKCNKDYKALVTDDRKHKSKLESCWACKRADDVMAFMAGLEWVLHEK
jgi:hypothetical protein